MNSPLLTPVFHSVVAVVATVLGVPVPPDVVVPSNAVKPRFDKDIFRDARKDLWRILELDVFRRWKTGELNRQSERESVSHLV